MSTVLSIARNEARRIFVSPLAWAVLFVLQLILAFIFATLLFSYAQSAQYGDQFTGVADFIGGGLFGFATVLLLLVMPLMTMRLFAEERKSGSITLLFSAPASLIEIVLGKFLGLVCFMFAVLVLLAIMPLTLLSGTHLDLGFIAAGLLGLFLMMLAFGAAGLFVSTLTKEPTIAAVFSFGLLLLVWLVQILGNQQIPFAEVFSYLSLVGHFEHLRRGVFNSADVVYYLLFTVFFLWLAVLRLDIERG
ncbi:MAG: ABC transporter permease subunit [Nevskia sp.]|nr:ABC transporter permease subunit [Nevskia sp.]